jgi:hypothetical protein
MLRMCAEMGFHVEADQEDIGIRSVRLKLGAQAKEHADAAT